MRRALLAAVLAAAASCGEPPAGPPSPPVAAKPAAPAAPSEATFGDAQLVDLVFELARTGRFDDLARLKLPPRCDRVRVAVRVLHENLLGVRKAPPDRGQLLDALAAMTRAEGGASAEALGPLLLAWRDWDESQAAAETAIARRSAAGFAALDRPDLDRAALTKSLAGAERAPPKSPATAELAFLRAASLIAPAASDDAVPKEYDDALARAEQAFDDLGWPGGFASAADVLVKRLLRANPKSVRALHLADLVQAAYARSHDEVGASLVFLTLSDAAERRGDMKQAEGLAEAGRERLEAADARGRELVDVLLRHGSLAQMFGKQAIAARELGRTRDEARVIGLDAALRVDIAEKLATSLFILGRFADAYDAAVEAMKLDDDAVAAGGKEIEPSRTTLGEIGAQSAMELSRTAEAATLYRAAAAHYASLAASDPALWAKHDADALLAAQAQLKGGDAAGAAKAIEAVTSRDGVAPAAHAHAATIWREAGRLADADRELSRAETEGGPAFADALTEERARLAAARGDTDGARALFRRAVARVTPSDPDAVVGWPVARVLLDWARMEMGLGRLFEASELAGRAVVQLRGSGLEMELDRARKLYVDLQRRRLWFGDAAAAAEQRIDAGPPGDEARREDALLDLLLIRIELLFQKQKDAETKALNVAEMFPEGWKRELAKQSVNAATPEHPWLQHDVVDVPADAPARWRLLHDVASGFGDLSAIAERCGAEEPELRRWIAPRVFENDVENAIELRRRADAVLPVHGAAALERDDEAIVLIEPCGAFTWVDILVGNGALGMRRLGDDIGLADLWDATFVDPSPDHFAKAAKRVADAVFTSDVAPTLAGVKRLYISVSEPLGPLPFDLLPYKDGLLIDSFDVVTVNSVTELIRARARPAPPMPAELSSPYASLDTRSALVRLVDVDAKARARLFELFGKFQDEGKDVSTALREAKLALRAEWKPDPKARPVLPPWAAFLLRGAP